jgi:thioredoxin reductase
MAGSEVLIIGAGPTGLMAACQLALRNIRFESLIKIKSQQLNPAL